MLAEIYHKLLHRDQDAMELLQEGLEIAPGNRAFAYKYARLLAEHGNDAAAAKVLLRGGLPTLKNDPEALELLAAVYSRLGESYLATQTYRNLLAARPDNGTAWYLLGSLLEEQRKGAEAVSCYKKALETGNLNWDLAERARRKLELHSRGSS